MSIFVVTTSIFAQSPQSFKYQEVIRDASRNIIANQNTAIKIDILQVV